MSTTCILSPRENARPTLWQVDADDAAEGGCLTLSPSASDSGGPPRSHDASPRTEEVDCSKVPRILPDVVDSEQPSSPPSVQHRRPFHKWVKTLNHRHTERRRLHQIGLGFASDRAFAPLYDGTDLAEAKASAASDHRHSSVSSFAYVAAIRDASLSGASASIVPSSRKQKSRSSKGLSRTDRSSHASYSVRTSEDGGTASTYDRQQKQAAEEAVVERSQLRRRILEEIIGLEEGYVGDLRALMDVYPTIVASMPPSETGLRQAMYSSVMDLVGLHQELLDDLRRVVSITEEGQAWPRDSSFACPPLRSRPSRNLDAVPEDKTEGLRLYEASERTADPHMAAEAAGVFSGKMSWFFVYEEYGAIHGMVLDDLKAGHRSAASWSKHKRGLETLVSCKQDKRDPRRAVSIYDLLAKPIQTACRYPLLFKELLKSTPVCDCPGAHADIENTLLHLEEVAAIMNRATDDMVGKALLQKTWTLQNRLRLPNESTRGASKSLVRSFGRIQLCGVLHVCWQTKTSVTGRYMLCLLYRHWLCLAVAEKPEKVYTLQACLPLSSCTLEEADNGKGLQCHSAPFSWKVVFECHSQMHEMLLTAGSKKEECAWRQIGNWRGSFDGQIQPGTATFCYLGLDIKSIGTVFRRPGTLDRELSIRRATTVASKAQRVQVIIKHTNSEKSPPEVPPRRTGINRSQSLQTNSRIPVLVPSQADRARLEAAVADVWTRDTFLFPGLTLRKRGERLRRSSASSIIRKISVVSLSGTFGRRSVSRMTATKELSGPTKVPEWQADERDDSEEQADCFLKDSFDTEGVGLYALEGGRPAAAEDEGEGDSHLRSESVPRTSTETSRRSFARFIEEIDRELGEPEKAGAASVKTAVPKGMGQAACSKFRSTTGTRSTADLSTSSSVLKMMPPLTPQPRKASSSSSAKPGRRWLGNALFHRRSLHRPFRKLPH